MATREMMLAAAGSGGGMSEILAALFPPAAMAVIFVLICRTALRNTDWKKQEDDGRGVDEQSPREKPPHEPGRSV